MRGYALALIVVFGIAADARAQAWLAPEGEITTSFVYANLFADGHDLSGVKDPNGRIYTHSLTSDVTFGIRDNLSIGISIPLVGSKFETLGTPPHPTIQDDGKYHTTFADLRFNLRYNVLTRRNFVLTPYIGAVTPSHAYQYFAHAAPGKRVNELQLGVMAGTTIDKLLPGMFVQGQYGFGLQEKFVDVSRNRSVMSLESGYFATPDIRVFGMLSGQITHGGRDLTRTSRLEWPTIEWQNHDRIARENSLIVGGGVGWSVNETLDVFGSYSTMVYERNTHVLDRGLSFGASIRLRPSAIERGIVTLNNRTNRIARCACQKGLALKR